MWYTYTRSYYSYDLVFPINQTNCNYGHTNTNQNKSQLKHAVYYHTVALVLESTKEHSDHLSSVATG